MNTNALPTAPIRRISNTLALLLQRPARRQVAALCFRRKKGRLEVLLITSRDTGRWILPKGWPVSKRSARKQAEREAFEEAGILGKAFQDPIGEYASHKGVGNGFKVRTTVTVFPMKVTGRVNRFPEKGQRELKWLPIEEAAKRCGEFGLAQILMSEKTRSLLMAG